MYIKERAEMRRRIRNDREGTQTEENQSAQDKTLSSREKYPEEWI